MKILYISITGRQGVACLKRLIESEHQVIGIITQRSYISFLSNRWLKYLFESIYLIACWYYKCERYEWIGSLIKIADRQNIPIYYIKDIKSDFACRLVSKLAPELIVIASWGQLIPQRIIKIPARGCINVHASLLPKYRGGNPLLWPIINGEQETGVTIHYVDSKFDTGDIILQRRIPISTSDNPYTLSMKLCEEAASGLIEATTMMENGKVQRIPQANEDATYYPMFAFDETSLLVDWSKSCREIHNKIKAAHRPMYCSPGPYTFYKGRQVKIWKGSPGKAAATSAGQPGEIVGIENGKGIFVATGDGSIFLTKLQLGKFWNRSFRADLIEKKLGAAIGDRFKSM